MVRSFVGGLQLITNLLRSDDKQVIIRKTNSHFFRILRKIALKLEATKCKGNQKLTDYKMN